MDMMAQYFQTALAPEQKEIAARVQDRDGAQAVIENDRLLRELVDLYRTSDGAVEVSGARGRCEVGIDIEELRLEIREDIEVAVERNAETFSRKFEMQRKQIVDELTKAIHREGDRIIDAVTAGPHDRIIDPVSSPLMSVPRCNSWLSSGPACNMEGDGASPAFMAVVH